LIVPKQHEHRASQLRRKVGGSRAQDWLHDDWPQVETSPNWNLMTVQRRKRLSSVSKEIVASREPKKEQRLF
jgi:hypothetical protein